METRDRINEVYYGRLHSLDFQKVLKERVHWICNHVEGDNVLDIGCSQGITSLLLGREGYNVTAIDIDKESINYANNELIKEEDMVQKRINFLHGDVIDYDFGSTKYDTIIMGEIIEHLFKTEDLYRKVWDILNIEGKVIITTPFGINDHFDHKRTYYLANLFKDVHPYFKPIHDVQIIGKWICLYCRRRSMILNNELSSINIRFVEQAEVAFHYIERKLLDEIQQKKERIAKLSDKIEELENSNFNLEGNREN